MKCGAWAVGELDGCRICRLARVVQGQGAGRLQGMSCWESRLGGAGRAR
jgi:hypothetical protein